MVRSLKGGQFFRLFQRSLQYERQHGLADKIDGFERLERGPSSFIQISAEKYAAQSLSGMDFPGRIDPTTPPRKANVHQGDIGIVQSG
jgi:hypothetical protein